MGQDPYIEPRGGRQSNFMSNHLALDGLIAVDNGTTRFRGIGCERTGVDRCDSTRFVVNGTTVFRRVIGCEHTGSQCHVALVVNSTTIFVGMIVVQFTVHQCYGALGVLNSTTNNGLIAVQFTVSQRDDASPGERHSCSVVVRMSFRTRRGGKSVERCVAMRRQGRSFCRSCTRGGRSCLRRRSD